MKKHIHYTIAGSCLVLGMLFFLVSRNWLVVRLNLFTSVAERAFTHTHTQSVVRRDVTLHYWRDERWHTRKQSIIWLSDTAALIKHLVNRWGALLYDEHVIDKHVGIESVALSNFGQTAFLSFDQSPVNSGCSIQNKWRVFEGLCKTLQGAGVGIAKILFLVDHQPLCDDHLDFSQPWPIGGFDKDDTP